jgi:hypothetical protein
MRLQPIAPKPGVLRADGVSMPGARLDTACPSIVAHCFPCSRYPSVVLSSHSRSRNTIEGSRANVPGPPVALPIGRWWSSSMNAARFGRREASLDKPRKLLRRSTPIGGAISIHGSAQSLACPMSGTAGATTYRISTTLTWCASRVRMAVNRLTADRF